MFGHTSGPSKRYTYGCLPPIFGADEVETQLKLQHQYRNKLIEIELQRRQTVREAMLQDAEVAELTAQAADLEARLDELRGATKDVRKTLRKATDMSEADKDAVSILLKALKDVWDELKEAKKEAVQVPDIAAALAKAQVDANEAARQARHASGLYWGTYLTVEQGVQKARQSRTDPRFQRYDGTGSIAVQLQKGLSAGDIFGTDTRLRIEPIDPLAWTSPIRGERKRLSRTKVWLRVGSEGRTPIWTILPLEMHRPLPVGSSVKWAHLVRTKVATQFRYHLQLTVELAEGFGVPNDAKSAVGVDVGWRKIEGGLRVAMWANDEGESGELILPDQFLSRLQKAEDLRSIRDKNFDTVKATLSAWLAAREIPDWLKEETATFSQWKAPGRLASLVLKWRDNRFDSDTMGYDELEAWRKQDKHLYEWEANQRRKAINHRKYVYRQFAKELATKHGMVVLEKFDLRQVARSKNAEDGVETNITARSMRFVAAVSVLRQCIKEACANYGCKLEEVPSAYTTQKCHVCGHLDKFDAAIQIHHTCSSCGELWDQDYNAAKNLLQAATAQV